MRPLLRILVPVLLIAPGVGAEEAKAKKPAWRDFELVASLEGHSGLVRCVAFAPDGKTLVTGGSDRTVRVWDAATGKARAKHQLPRSG